MFEEDRCIIHTALERANESMVLHIEMLIKKFQIMMQQKLRMINKS